MQYGNQLASTYSQLKIHIVTVEKESKEKPEELNKKIEEVKSSILHNNNVPEVESNIHTIPSLLNDEFETVKAKANKVPGIESSIPIIPSDLNE
jgi:hypothetical protein